MKIARFELAIRILRLMVLPLEIVTLSLLLGCASAQSYSTDPVIIFEHHGPDRGDGGVVFSLSLFEDGTVLFLGKNQTRVSGKVRTNVTPERVKDWIGALVKSGALDFRERPTYAPPPDGSWSRLTVAASGRSNTYRFHGWNRTAPTIRILQEMLDDIDVLKKWVN